MENKSKKISLGTAICLVIIVILVIVVALEYYFGFVKKNEEIENIKGQMIKQQNEYEQVMKKELMQKLTTEKEEAKENTLQRNNTAQANSTSSIFNNTNSIKIFNVGTGVNPVLFIITNDGEVYEMPTSNLEFGLNSALKNYKVENILNKTGEMASIFEVLLKDGTKTTVTEDLINVEEDTENENISKEEFAMTLLNNTKNFKIYNVGTAVNPVLFVITNDGKVYEARLDNLDLNLNKALEKYKVEDILNKTGEMANVFEILLKDGTKTTVTENLE